jgi:hypothetical protein
MNAYVRRLVNSLAHLSDENLCKLLDDELSSIRDVRARAHLANCWQCRVRFEQLEKAAHQVVEYRNFHVLPRLPLDPKRRDSFLVKLDRLMDEASSTPWSLRFLSEIHSLSVTKMNSFIASFAVVMFAVVMLFVIWQRAVVPVSAAELLDRAEVWDTNPIKAGGPGVVYQRVRITTPHRTIERDLFRNAQRGRHPKAEPVSAEMAPLKAKLELAGVSWEEPLSAVSYKDWRDRQELVNDEVSRSGKNLLTLTTTSSRPTVLKESLTVRKDDFHPVQRTAMFVDEGTIEIAEENYAILDWNAVNSALFEALPSVTPPIVVGGPANIHPLPPALPTSMQLDNAELQARLALNRLNADTGEEIRVTRGNKDVEVKGVVEADERKREIVARLDTIPYVDSSILSIQELRNSSNPVPPTSVKEYSLVAQPSPLGIYMQEKKLSADAVSEMSRRLLDACLQAQQGSSALSELLERFPLSDDLSPVSRAARNELITNYMQSIEAGLGAQEKGLKELGFVHLPGVGPPFRQIGGVNELAAATQRNQMLCRELIAGDTALPRAGEAVAAELLETIARIRSLLSLLRGTAR